MGNGPVVFGDDRGAPLHVFTLHGQLVLLTVRGVVEFGSELAAD